MIAVSCGLLSLCGFFSSFRLSMRSGFSKLSLSGLSGHSSLLGDESSRFPPYLTETSSNVDIIFLLNAPSIAFIIIFYRGSKPLMTSIYLVAFSSKTTVAPWKFLLTTMLALFLRLWFLFYRSLISCSNSTSAWVLCLP